MTLSAMLKRLTLLSLALVASLTLAFGAPDGEIERRIAALDGVCETKPLLPARLPENTR